MTWSKSPAFAGAAWLAGLLLVAGACGGDSNDGGAGSPSASPSLSGTAPATGAVTLGLGPGQRPTPLSPGSYRNEVTPVVAFRLGEGWSAALPAAGHLVLSRAEGSLVVVAVDGVFDPATGEPAAVPANLTEWLQAHPGLVSTKASSLQVDNVPARQLESAPAAGARDPLELVSGGGEALALASGEKAHIVVLETGLVIAAVAPEAQFDALFGEIEGVVGSMALER